MVLEQQTVMALLPDVAGLSVIDAGCGSGRYLRELRDLGTNPIGIDLSGAMLVRAREITSRLSRANIGALPIASATIDLIVCALALGDVPRLDTAIAEMARVLRPGGRLVYSVVHPIGGPKGWQRTFEAHDRSIAIDGYWHTAEQHRQACAAAGLRITAWEEPLLPEAPEFPAVLVVRAQR